MNLNTFLLLIAGILVFYYIDKLVNIYNDYLTKKGNLFNSLMLDISNANVSLTAKNYAEQLYYQALTSKEQVMVDNIKIINTKPFLELIESQIQYFVDQLIIGLSIANSPYEPSRLSDDVNNITTSTYESISDFLKKDSLVVKNIYLMSYINSEATRILLEASIDYNQSFSANQNI